MSLADWAKDNPNAAVNDREGLRELGLETINNPDFVNRLNEHSVYVKHFEGKGTMVVTANIDPANQVTNITSIDWLIPLMQYIREERKERHMIIQ